MRNLFLLIVFSFLAAPLYSMDTEGQKFDACSRNRYSIEDAIVFACIGSKRINDLRESVFVQDYAASCAVIEIVDAINELFLSYRDKYANSVLNIFNEVVDEVGSKALVVKNHKQLQMAMKSNQPNLRKEFR